ncbi:MAG: DUF896 domain-containing protein [Oscillospiraceae bacterium]
MEQQKLDRINELAHLAKQRELNAAETAEREVLRGEYIAEWKRGATATLENTYVVDADGNKRKLNKK